MSLADILRLFGWSLAALVAFAVAAPTVGAVLYARGATIQGIVLPQLATLGVAIGFALGPLFGRTDGHAHGVEDPSRAVLYLCAAAATAIGLAVHAWLRERGRHTSQAGRESARGAATFAIASGGTILVSHLAPFGGLHVRALLAGEALAVAPGDAWLAVGVGAAVVATLVSQWRPLTLAGHDPDFARVIGLSTFRAHLVAAALTAAVVIVGTLTIGPLPLFALLVLPPLGARQHARSMAHFLVGSSVSGVLGAAAGAALSFSVDLPLGASVVAGAFAVALAHRLLRL